MRAWKFLVLGLGLFSMVSTFGCGASTGVEKPDNIKEEFTEEDRAAIGSVGGPGGAAGQQRGN